MGKVVLAIAVLFGGLLLFGGAWEARRISLEKDWPTVKGVVQDAKHYEADGSTWVEVEYSYDIDGTQYTDTSSVDTMQTRSVPAAYRELAEVTVHYDASRPDHSYLEHADYESPIVLTIFGVIVLLICSPFIIMRALLIYADLLLRKAEYHMREGLKALEEGQDEVDAMRARGEEIPQELLDRESEVLDSAQNAHAMLKDIKKQRASLD